MLVAHEMSNRQIAQELSISKRTPWRPTSTRSSTTEPAFGVQIYAWVMEQELLP